MMIRRTTLLAATALALSVAGCANGGGGPAEPVGAPAPQAPASSAVPTEETSTPVDTSTRTISGTISAGVEPGCLMLDDNLLIIRDEKLRPAAKDGASVTVTGRSQPGTMTTCMQGTPFVVTSIRAN
ncbi:hypothetical protein COUCH_31910 [Couchioplanes caeruleus]|uniref:hypothetical protein n=1 Tax=Couchioplanes caeruleus TaxID=56438 RepID=UPI0020C1012B|nr:hypothetical protein [Couchioplanes caeruleus]UQU63569.1 hypothetical protein COUCH_31910 [Couchioplanes caeruleus]